MWPAGAGTTLRATARLLVIKQPRAYTAGALTSIRRSWPTTENVLATALLYSLIPLLAALVGGVVAAVREPGPTLRSALQHFAAGVVVGVAALELLPDADKAPLTTLIPAFLLGVLVMLAVRALGRRLEGPEAEGEEAAVQAPRWPLGLLAATGIDLLVDGLLVGIGFAIDPAVGLVVTIALALEVLFVAVAISTTLAHRHVSRSGVILIPLALTVLLSVGAAIGALFFAGLSRETLAPVLAFGAAALMYLVTEELLGEAHEEDERAVVSFMFFLGFAVFLVMDKLTPA